MGSGDWQLVIDGLSPFVFNVRTDPGERKDVTLKQQEVARRRRPLLDAWEKNVGAEWKASAANVPRAVIHSPAVVTCRAEVLATAGAGLPGVKSSRHRRARSSAG